MTTLNRHERQILANAIAHLAASTFDREALRKSMDLLDALDLIHRQTSTGRFVLGLALLDPGERVVSLDLIPVRGRQLVATGLHAYAEAEGHRPLPEHAARYAEVLDLARKLGLAQRFITRSTDSSVRAATWAPLQRKPALTLDLALQALAPGGSQ